ncbi:MAG: prepilin-type N-terminal cleavage/methylation domain-containing protein [Phycisphaerales bacterium]|nr:prepilin-type N-terminal cleavage/methylation domain-containing protein [Phycisphaerales bacterium]
MKKTDDTSLTNSFRPIKRSAGFSLVELLVTLSIIALLFSIMFPSLNRVRGVAGKLMCANNMRSIYYGLNGYANDFSRSPLPYCYNYKSKLLQETMALTANDPDSPYRAQWDGLGLLWRNVSGTQYLDNCKCLFCPSHHGTNGYEKYRSTLNCQNPRDTTLLDVASHEYLTHPKTIAKIYGNYQYAGGYDPQSKEPISFGAPNSQNSVLLSDGMRTLDDFNHTIGGNALRGSGEISWFSYSKIIGLRMTGLPAQEIPTNAQESQFSLIWTAIQTEAGR